MSKTLRLLLFLSLFFLLSSCSTRPAVNFGALLPLSGALEESGAAFKNASQLAIEHLSSVGISVNLIIMDTEASPPIGLQRAQTLIDDEQVLLIIGPASSAVTILVAESATIPAGIPLISNATTSMSLTNLESDKRHDLIFRTSPSDVGQSMVLANLAHQKGYQRAGIFWVNNSYGSGFMEKFSEEFISLGGTIVASVSHEDTLQESYITGLNRIMEENPDFILALSYQGQAEVYLQEFFNADYNEIADLMFVDGTKSSILPQIIGPEKLDGFVGTAPFLSPTDASDIFLTDYIDTFGEEAVLPFIANTYDAIVVGGLAAAKCSFSNEEITSECIRNNIREVSNPPGEIIIPGKESLQRALGLLIDGKAINYQGASGAVNFDEFGDVTTAIEIWQYTIEPPYIKTIRIVPVENLE